MGDNANIQWEWHNHDVGKGYQARGVVRQPGVQASHAKLIDFRPDLSTKLEVNPSQEDDENGCSRKRKCESTNAHKVTDSGNDSIIHRKKQKKEKKAEKSKKKKHKKMKQKKHKEVIESERELITFNPLLQLLATRLSNKTRSFSPTNSIHK
mmetsp:Transcript_31897/g.32517  ORF Transcript_31897/g.32517 Transcript_31897/m.32517 type:complete len:152 (+) Transcript_31897:132-587(+)|eukprot:CAMPEP_0182431282 /NCGR_PEP_ID=MMETSP1167-20130531/47862_1 /TAXON_ID=2988 /ORGANISM="Mallomonas Sp, Strain CCMP3275" /LENGTH=151 /DNA_ID=CAMNT_0024617435 /DNA_START=33 /DNA_END=488 /DNA_ORIENTATION=-